MVVAQLEAAGGVAAEVAELLPDRHADGLERLVAGAALAHVPAESLGVPVLGDGEEPDLAIAESGDLGGIGRPHQVRRVCDDAAVVRLGRAALRAVRRQQGVLAHQPQHPLARDANAVEHAQARPDLAVTLSGPGRAREVRPNGGKQVGIGDRRLRPAPGRRGRRRPRRSAARGIEARPRHAPDPADPRDAVAPSGGGRDRLGHHRRLLRAKGPGTRSIFARSSSFSMLSSPMRRMAAASSPSAVSVSRSFSAPSSPASAFVRQRSSL